MPRTNPRMRVFVATQSFVTQDADVTAGVTRIREGHPLLKRYPDWFAPVEDQHVHYDVETATAAPGELRGEE